MPTVADRALQRSASQVLSATYEQDFLSCSFGGRTGSGAHQALATLHERISGGKIEWVLEADLKNFFGSLSHEWLLRTTELADAKQLQQEPPRVMVGTGPEVIQLLHRAAARRALAVTFTNDEQMHLLEQLVEFFPQLLRQRQNDAQN